MHKIARKVVKSALPAPILDVIKHLKGRWRLIRSYYYDYSRYVGHSSFGSAPEREKLGAEITMLYHSLEKGLALREPRQGFGRDKAGQLLMRLEYYLDKYGSDLNVLSAICVLEKYYSGCHDQSDEASRRLLRLRQVKAKQSPDVLAVVGGGTRRVSREEIYSSGRIDLDRFFSSRYSIRQFTAEQPARSVLERAVKMAQKTPCVCNRQSSRVLVVQEKETIARALDLQEGARGFDDEIQTLLVITSRLSHFVHIGERSQSYIDGGLFAMTLIYALHSLGVASCCLNWSKECDTDVQIRNILPIEAEEVIIMFLAVGYPPENFDVAYSQRANLFDVVRFV